MNPTSEAYFTTDPFGPGDHASPNDVEGGQAGSQSPRQNGANLDGANDHGQFSQPPPQAENTNLVGSPNSKRPGSTHSRGSGTANSPIDVEDDLGGTRRLLFPSPRKDGIPKVLGELAVNVVHTGPSIPLSKMTVDTGKEENKNPQGWPASGEAPNGDDLDLELFGTPPRPSTPPPNGAANNGPFKTPTRPTPSHRPITRSISRSIRTVKSIPRSPSQVFMQLQRTPSKTPRSTSGSNNLSSSGKRRTPRQGAHLHAHFDSPFTTTLNQLLSEANGFTEGSPSHGLGELDLSSLPNLNSDDVQHLANSGALDFGNYLSTDMVMPSSPPLLRNHHSMDFGGALKELGQDSEF